MGKSRSEAKPKEVNARYPSLFALAKLRGLPPFHSRAPKIPVDRSWSVVVVAYALQYVPLPSVTESRDMGSFHPTPVEQLRCSPQSCITHCIHPPHIMSPARSEAKGCVRWLQLPVRNPGSRDRTNICQMTAKKDKTLEAGGEGRGPGC